MIKINYKIEDYRDDPRLFDGFFYIIARVLVGDKIYVVVDDTSLKERYIKEYISNGKQTDYIKQGDILATIEDDSIWNRIYEILKKEEILT